MARRERIKLTMIITLTLIAAAMLSISAVPQQVSLGCCCNLNSGQAQKPGTQSQSECTTGYTYTQLTPPFEVTETICTGTCGSAVLPPVFPPTLLKCGDPLFKPKVKNLEISNQKGTNNLRLKFDTECLAQTNYFDISRCKGTYEICAARDYKTVTYAPKDTKEYIDKDPTLRYHTDYTYKVVVNYQYANGNSEPTFITGNPGDLECDGVLSSDNFCIGDITFYSNNFKDYLQTYGYPPVQPDEFRNNFNYVIAQLFGSKLNSAFTCNSQNQLQNTLKCSQTANPDNKCVVRNNMAQCLGKEDCKQPQPGTALGFGFNTDNCEKKAIADQYGGIGSPRYCFFDRSGSVANDCFDCRQDMNCYDYRTKVACEHNNCGAGACAWADIYPTIGIGVCRDLRASNCFLCDIKGTPGVSEKGYNEIFDVCSPAKNAALSVPGHPCNYQSGTKTSTDCNAITCRDYDTQQSCATPSGGIRLNPDNSIAAASNDACNLRVCAWNAGMCAKDADAKNNLEQDRRDCTGKQNIKECELDTVPPTTTIVPYSQAPGRTDALIISRMDAFNRTMDPIVVQPTDYPTWFCVYPAGGAPCTTFNVKTHSKSILVQNARIQDGTTVLAALSVGNNTIRYYSEDPNHNLEIVKEAPIVACDRCQGPPVNNSDVSNSLFDAAESRHYTRDTAPYVIVQWNVPVAIQRGLFLASGQTAIDSTATDISATAGQPSKTRWKFTPKSTPQTANIVFSTFATDIGTGIAMEREYLVNITIDPTPPNLNGATISDPITQSGYTKQSINSVPVLHVPKPPLQIPFVSTNTINFVLNFSEFVILDNISIEYNNFTKYTSSQHSMDITSRFETSTYYQTGSTNKTFTIINGQLPDGSNTLKINVHDRATNTYTATVPYVQSSGAPQARLYRPALGGSSTAAFDLEVQTLAPASCRYFIQTVPELGAPANTDLWSQFETTGGTSHIKTGTSLPRQEEQFPLKVYCKDAAGREGISTFSLIYDPTLPIFNSSYPRLDPDTIIEQPATTTLSVVTDDYTFCKYDFAKAPSTPAGTYDNMPYTFAGFNDTSLKVHSAEITVTDFSLIETTTYNVITSCKNRAGIGPVTSQVIQFKVVPNIPFGVNSTTKVSFNETPVFVGAISNKRSNCYYQEAGSRWLMEADGQPSRSHKVQVPEREGSHTGTITCQPTGISSIGTAPDNPITIPVSYIVDTTNPIMEWVNDSTSNTENPRISTLRDNLLLAYEGNDGQGSGINYYKIVIKNLSSPYPYKNVTIKEQSRWHFNATRIFFNVANKTRYQAEVTAIDMVDRRSQPMRSAGVETDFSKYPGHCTNQVFDPSTETDKDCGGECAPCPEGKTCGGNADCQSLTCTGIESRTCKQNPTCTDGELNGDETGTDCGGPCQQCTAGGGCNVNSDCKNYNNADPSIPILLCKLGKCTAAGACENGIKGIDESDIDCGGPCPACADGLQCRLNADCNYPTSTCDTKYLIKLNYSTPINPPSYQETTLLVSGGGIGGGAPSDAYLQGLYGTNTSFVKVPQYGVCVNQVIDTDRDGMTDAYEDRHGLDKKNPIDAFIDNDKDGLNNLQEYQYYNTSSRDFGQIREIDPMRADTDGDGYDDSEEKYWLTNPVDATSRPPYHDRDGDGMSDIWETRQGLDPTNKYDGNDSLTLSVIHDPDRDNLTNWQEFNYTTFSGVLQESADSDHPAKELVPRGTMLSNGKSSGFDTDNDGWSDNQEIINKNLGQPFDPLDPNLPPRNIDSDKDGMPDWWERKHDLNPFNPADAPLDYDKDNLTNLYEFQYLNLSGTVFGSDREIDPRNADTDGDMFSDSQEIKTGTNPTDSGDPPASPTPPRITLANPSSGVSPTTSFALRIAVDINSSCRFAIVEPGVAPPNDFMSLVPFDNNMGALYNMSYEHTRTQTMPPNTLYTLWVQCIDGFKRSNRQPFDLMVDTTPPTMTAISLFPNPVEEQPFTVSLQTTTDDPTICKWGTSQASDYTMLPNTFPGGDSTPPQYQTGHTTTINIPTAGAYTLYAACKNKAGLTGTISQVSGQANAGASLRMSTNDPTPLLFDSAQARITAITNKRANCDLAEGTTKGTFSTINGYEQLLQTFATEGKHTGTQKCTTLLGEQQSTLREYTVDSIPPQITSAKFIEPDKTKPGITYLQNQLELNWTGFDPAPGSGIKLFNITIRNQTQSTLVQEELPATTTTKAFSINLANLTSYTAYIGAVDQAGHASGPQYSTIFADFSKAPPHCSDGLKDSDETDTDCGGSCTPCEIDNKCGNDADCKSTFCSPTLKLCKTATCTDTLKNGFETDIDCGGSTSCTRCTISNGCLLYSDCLNHDRSNTALPVLVCGTDNKCQIAPPCKNKVLDLGESDIDCGQVCGQQLCTTGKTCNSNLDCATNPQLNCTTLWAPITQTNPTPKCIDLARDYDNDGMADWWEDKWRLNHKNPSDAMTDPDSDGMTNYQEYRYYSTTGRQINPFNADTDDDQFKDGEEAALGSDPTNPNSKPAFHDDDNDGMPNEWEIRYGLNPNSSYDAAIDSDTDELINLKEFQYNYNSTLAAPNCAYTQGREISPRNKDTDNDTYTDYEEVLMCYDPTDPNSPSPDLDTDRDGMPDIYERRHKLNATNPADAAWDPDHDTLTNLQEYQYYNLSMQKFGQTREIDPQMADTDLDSYQDGAELRASSNPINNTDPGYEATRIRLSLPQFGITASQPFMMQAATSFNSTCRFWFSAETPPVTPPDIFGSLDSFDSPAAGATSLTHTKNSVSGIATTDRFKQFPLYVTCIDAFARQRDATFNLSLDDTAPTILQAYSDPYPIAQSPLKTNLVLTTDHPSFCKYSLTQTDYTQMEGLFPGIGSEPVTIHTTDVTVPSAATFTYNVACMSPAGLGPTSKTIPVRVDPTVPLQITSRTAQMSDTSQPLISALTNKDAVCDFIEETSTIRLGDGTLRRLHETRLSMAREGRHTAQVRCTTPSSISLLGKSETVSINISYLIDTQLPIMTFVSDDGPILTNPEISYFRDMLKVKWKGTDAGGISNYYYKLQDQNQAVIIDNTPSTKEDEWVWATANLTDKTRYVFSVFAKDYLNHQGYPLSSNGVMTDFGSKPTHCTNGIKDANLESDTDCGIECPPCSTTGSNCGRDIDCTSGFCNIYTNPARCAMPTCTDTYKNGLETDIDCGGGTCNTCAEGKTCISKPDCAGNLTCKFNGQKNACTKATSCENGQLDPGESDIDCGGSCAKCGETKLCKTNDDCAPPYTCNPDPAGQVMRCYDPGLDTDKDGIPDAYEIRHGLKWNDPADAYLDPDKDLLTNLQEYTYYKNSQQTFNQTREINPQKWDTDGDTFSDKEEIDIGTNPIDSTSKPPPRDTDRDGMPDEYEDTHGLNKNDPTDAARDFDGDLLVNLQEYNYYKSTGRDMDPRKYDTDKDGFNDKVEIDSGTDPTDPASHPPLIDSDADGMPDTYELKHYLNPLDPTDARLDPDLDNLTNINEYLYYSVTAREIDPRNKDTDSDIYLDYQEIILGSNPIDPNSRPANLTSPTDTDRDGMPDAWEIKHGLNPNDPTDAALDPDRDGLTNLQEFQYYQFTGRDIDPQARDTDNDGYTDGQEITAGTNPVDSRSKPSYPPDTDGDGMPNDWEVRHALNPNDPSDAALDPDRDGLTNLEEFQYYQYTGREIDPQKADTDVDGANDKVELLAGTNPLDPNSKPDADSDKDGMPDAWEVKHGLNPNDPTDAALDPDRDGLTNLQEYIYYKNTGREIDPKNPDSDGDTYNDLNEILLGFNPTDPNSKPPAPTPLPSNDKDNDGIADDWEARHNLNPSNASDAAADPDGDGLTNLQEYQYYAVTGREIDPYKWDTDKDGYSDKQEIIAGTNPLDAKSYPPSLPFLDSDNDGIPDWWEVKYGLNPNDPNDATRDTDKDGLINIKEYEYFRDTQREIDPTKADTDSDGFTDTQEILFGSNPVDYKSKPPLQDSDADGMDDLWEVQHALNPNDPTDAALDPDKDKMTNLEEYQYWRDTKRNINPQNPDTDNDSYSDLDEVMAGSDPTDARSIPPECPPPALICPPKDCNNDGIPDNYAKRHNLTVCEATDAFKDYDNDTMTNLHEYQYFLQWGREIDPRKSDTDHDSWRDNQERDCASNPVDNTSKCTTPPPVNITDTDRDGMPDDWETRYGLNPTDPTDANIDSDGDTLTNLQEYQYYLNSGKTKDISPKNADTDSDTYNDYVEINANPPTDPTDPNSKPTPGGGTGGGIPPGKRADTDKDGIPDTWETKHGLDPNDPSDAQSDPDMDGLKNIEEYRYYRNTGREIDPQSKDTDGDGYDDKEEIDAGTNPVNINDHPIKAGQDSDSDGMPDEWETRHGLDPKNPADAAYDLDHDGLTSLEEYNYYKQTGKEIDPQKADTDNDGYTDKEEITASTDPTDPFSKPTKPAEGVDTDSDGMPDSWETKHGLDPNNPYDADLDPDKDGMTNKAEYDYFKQTGQEINPQKADTDSDGFSDKAEIEAGTNPTDSSSKPAAVTPPEGALDTDTDGMPDEYEEAHGLDKNDPTDALQDPAGSGMTNLDKYEYFKKTGKFIDPFKADTDEDGYTDKQEIDSGTDPTDPASHPSGLDTDTDGMPDDWEIRHGLDPNDPSDAGLDPAQSGMTNLQKYEYYKLTGRDLDPFKSDNDADNWNDSEEIAAETNPLDPQDHPTSKLWILAYTTAVLSLLGGGGYAIYKLLQAKPPIPKPTFKPAIPEIKPEIKPAAMPPKPPAPSTIPKEDIFKKLQQVGKPAGQPQAPQLTPLERLAIEGLPEFEKEKIATQLEKLRKGQLSKEERETLFKKLRETAAYWATHKEELATQKATWLAAKGTTVTKAAKSTAAAPSKPATKPATAAVPPKPAAAQPAAKPAKAKPKKSKKKW